jgi:hypothetical protein
VLQCIVGHRCCGKVANGVAYGAVQTVAKEAQHEPEIKEDDDELCPVAVVGGLCSVLGVVTASKVADPPRAINLAQRHGDATGRPIRVSAPPLMPPWQVHLGARFDSHAALKLSVLVAMQACRRLAPCHRAAQALQRAHARQEKSVIVRVRVLFDEC